MAEFAHNNAKNTGTRHAFFELNYNYHPQAYYKKNINL